MAVSGKRHLFLTGGRGAGKTTLLKALLPLLCPEPVPGVCTRAIPGDGVDLAEMPSGRVTRVGVFDPALPGPENRMRPVPGGFSGAGVEALDACMESPCPWAFVDEVGYLESQDTAYRDALLRLLDKKRVAAVLRSQNLPFLNELKARPDACLVDLDRPFGQIGCVIMASGLGRRFGGGKLLARRLSGLGARVTVSARTCRDLAWIEALGYGAERTDQLAGWLCGYDVIFNTVPARVMQEPLLADLSPDCLVIDLASRPGGVDQAAAERLGVKVIWALSLPGKVAPVTAGKAIRDTIYHMLREAEG